MNYISPTTEQVAKIAERLRVTASDKVNDEIAELIGAACVDMQRQGVDIINLADPLTWQAAVLYCKAHYGYDNNTDRFEDAYLVLTAAMSLCGDYDDSEGGDG